MRRLAAAALIWAGAIGTGAADPAPVRSGEHATFSRLVIYFDVARPDWRLGRIEGGYELRTGDADVGYDTGGVFDLIPRDRIARLTPGVVPGSLRIELACDCAADAFEFAETAVVVDIRDGSPAPDSPFEVAFASGSAPWREVFADGPFPFGSEQAPVAVQLFERAPVSQTDPQLPVASRPRVQATRTAILKQVSRAAAQGLLESTASAEVDEAKAQVGPAASDSVTTTEPDATPDPVTREAEDHLRVRTAVDVAWQARRPEGAQVLEGRSRCLPSESFDVATWGAGTGAARLSDFRGKLVGEFDVGQPEGVRALARHYVHLTFGAEALALLAAFDTQAPGDGALRALAHIVDGRPIDPFDLPAGQEICEGPVALWAVLARPKAAAAPALDQPAIITAFSALPLHMRRHVGPDLARAFVAAERLPTARAIRNAVARAPGPHGPEFELAQAKIDLSDGARDNAADRLRAIVRDGSEAAPEAVAELLETTLSASQEVQPATIETAATYAYEMKGTGLGRRLEVAAIRAQLATDAFDNAFDAIARMAAGADRAGLRAEAYAALAERGENAAFLRHAARADATLGAGAREAGVRRDVARRFLVLGLAGPARALVADIGEVPAIEDRLILARAALLEDRPEIAQSYLAGLDTPEALAIEAEVLARTGDHAAAAERFARIGDDDRRLSEAWRAGDWATVAERGADVRGAAAALAVPADGPADGSAGTDAAAEPDEVAVPAAQRGTLAENRRLLSTTAEMRGRLDRLLEETRLPDN